MSLRQHDQRLREAASPERKLGQTLQVMASGLRLQRAKLAMAHPGASKAELEALFNAWLFRE